jgi:hypothetical protein
MARFQIFFSTRQTDAQRALPPARRPGRVKVIAAALLLASAFIAFLIAALVLGSILAVFLIILITVASTLAIFKVAIHRPWR